MDEGEEESQTVVMSLKDSLEVFLPEKNTLVLHALIEGLSDEKLLVQREVLELITTYMRFDSNVFTEPYLHQLVKAALLLLTRKELSLTRRLFGWLLNCEGLRSNSAQESEAVSRYFMNFACRPTIAALKDLFRESEQLGEHFTNAANDIPDEGDHTEKALEYFLSNQELSTEPGRTQRQKALPVNAILRPIRVLEQLVEREEIGNQIIDAVLGDVLAMLASYRPDWASRVPLSRDVLKQVQDFLDMLENRSLWSYLVLFAQQTLSRFSPTKDDNRRKLEDSDSLEYTRTGAGGIADDLQLLAAVLDTLMPPTSADELSELVLQHYPLMLQTLVDALPDVFVHGNTSDLRRVLQLILKVMGKIPTQNDDAHTGPKPRDLQVDSDEGETEADPDGEQEGEGEKEEEEDEHACDTGEFGGTQAVAYETQPAVPDKDIMTHTTESFSAFFAQFVSTSRLAEESTSAELAQVFEVIVEILTEIYLRSPLAPPSAEPPVWFPALCACIQSQSSLVAAVAVRGFLALVDVPVAAAAANAYAEGGFAGLCRRVALRLWDMLSRSNSAVHYDAVSCFMKLELIDPPSVRSVMGERMLAGSIAERVDGYQRFSLLWKLAGEAKGDGLQTRPFTSALFTMLDTLQHEHPDIRLIGRSWLADNADKAERILDPLLLVILDPATLRREGCIYAHRYDIPRVLSVLRVLRVLFDGESGVFAARALQKLVSRDVMALNDTHNASSRELTTLHVVHYVDLITVASLRFIQGAFAPGTDAESVAANEVVQATAAELLNRMLTRVGVSSSTGPRISSCIQGTVLSSMAQAISNSNQVLQVHLLSLLRTMIQIDANALRNGLVCTDAGHDDGDQHDLSFQHEATQCQPVMDTQMFLQTLVIGLLQPPRKNLRSYWLDFTSSSLSVVACSRETRASLLNSTIEALAGIIMDIPCEQVLESVPWNDIMNILRTLSSLINTELAMQAQEYSDFAVVPNRQGTVTSTATAVTAVTAVSATASGAAAGAVGAVGAGAGTTAHTEATMNGEDLFHNQQSLFEVTLSHNRTRSSSAAPSLPSPATDKTLGSPRPTSTTTTTMTTTTAATTAVQQGLATPTQTRSRQQQQQQEQQRSPGRVGSPDGAVAANPLGWMLPSMFVDIFRDTAAEPAGQAELALSHVLLTKLPVLLRVIFHVYSAPAVTASPASSSSKVHNKYVLQDQIFRILDPLMKRYPFDVVGALQAQWPRDAAAQRVALEILNTMEAATEETILQACSTIVSEHVAAARRAAVRPGGAAQPAPTAAELRTLDFAQRYVDQAVSSDGLSKAWPWFAGLVRTAVTYLWTAETGLRLLGLVHQYFGKVCGMEEKRGRKVGVADRRERQDLVHRLYEAVVATLNQVYATVSQFVTEADYRSALDDSAAGVDRNLGLMRAVATLLLPTLALVYDEQDRLAYLTASLAHQMVLFTRIRWSPHAEAAVRFFGQSCAFPFAVRAWRKDVWDAFHENDFFAATGSSSLAPYALLAYWTVPLNQLMVQDRLAWADLLRVVGKNLQYQPSMFAREHSGLARSRHLRRLAFVLFAGSQDQYGRSIPMLKERLVDAFKIPATPLLQAQVFLCLRVMFLRFSVSSMLSFMPVVLTELLDALCTMPLSTNPLDLDALLAACKLIDTMLLLSDSSFLLHDWLFVTNPAHSAPATAFHAFLAPRRLPIFHQCWDHQCC